jgi:diguanylate cyclase (GGDEF)-like protein
MPTAKELEKELKRLRQLVYCDELTGLYNRRGFNEESERIFKGTSAVWKRKHQRNQEVDVALSVIFFDADNFKMINDVYGHDVGDAVLKKIAELLKKHLRTSDIVARWGGEEFVVALFGAPAQDAPSVAERIRKDIETTKLPKETKKKLKVTVSVGIATYNGEDSLLDLINHADEAMYRAKAAGKNKVVIYDRLALRTVDSVVKI